MIPPRCATEAAYQEDKDHTLEQAYGGEYLWD